MLMDLIHEKKKALNICFCLPSKIFFVQTSIFGLLIPTLYETDIFSNAYDYPGKGFCFSCSRYFLQ